MDFKTPKGTTDTSPEDFLIYEMLINKTKSIFQLHGAVPIDTPIFELKSILLNKYGEDSKLIYDLKDYGGEECALRYDLTVPFSRYMSMNKLKKIKKYQIGKVFRRDQPSIKQGRLREFIQADFDIAGEGLPMISDSEIICCINRLLKSYDYGDYIIRISDKRILFGIFNVCNIPDNLYMTVSSSIDKLDKLPIEEINKELKNKGLEDNQIENINIYIKMSGKEDILDFLIKSEVYKICKESIDELCLLWKYCNLMECTSNLIIDLSLARGLDYYTGMIIEGRYIGFDIGSVVGGGRYDKLIGPKNNNTSCIKDNGLSVSNNNSDISNNVLSTRHGQNVQNNTSIVQNNTSCTGHVPCVGFSIGITRIFSLEKNKQIKPVVDVFISSSGKLFIEERIIIQNKLWNNKINVETFYNKRVNLSEHKKYCQKKGIKYLLVIGEIEWVENNVILIDVFTNEKKIINIEEVINIIKH